MPKRIGHCNQCGMCCSLIKPACARLNLTRHADGKFYCGIHDRRPKECRTWPAPDNVRQLRMLKSNGSKCSYEWMNDDSPDFVYEEDGMLYRFAR